MNAHDQIPSAVCSPPRFEHYERAFGVHTARPRLSWTVTARAQEWTQIAYEVQIERDDEATVYPARDASSYLVPWPGETLRSRARALVSVRCQGDDQEWTPWSDPAEIETGLLSEADFAARMISPTTIGGLDCPAPIVFTDVTVDAPIRSARLYATSLGIHVPLINGASVADGHLNPGWTSYGKRLLYQTLDVTDALRVGANRLEFVLGNGWYRGYLGLPQKRARWGERLGILGQLEIVHEDGSLTTVATDVSWRARNSTVIADDLYRGETRRAGGPGAELDTVDEVPFDRGILEAPLADPVREVDTRHPIALFRSPSGTVIVDFGQNLVGWVRLRVKDGAAGTEVRLRHAEVLEGGELATRALRTAVATDTYTLDGGEQVLEPAFTFHGFRYASIEGLESIDPSDIEAVVLSSAHTRTGWLETSDPDLNRLHENVVWSMKGNFLSIPTDCPQRDERLGWTADIQVFSPTACFLYDSHAFLSSWLRDLALDQKADGSVPYVIPDTYQRDHPAVAAWSDAAVIVPWVLYQRYGDPEILRVQFDSMRRWVDRVTHIAGSDRIWVGGFQYGDWLDPTAPPDAPGTAVTDKDLVSTAHFARSADVLARAAAVLGLEAEAADYRSLAAEVRAAFQREFVTASGRLSSATQTAYSLALQWDLVPEDLRGALGERLLDEVRCRGFTIGTGFVGTPLILDALSDAGHVDAAYRLLLQTECPSWLYQVNMGATTVWERWDSVLPDGSVNPGWMTSLNHYAYGSVADWMHRTIGGIAPEEAGYRRVRVAPVPGGGLTWAKARHTTPHGDVGVDWTRDGAAFELTVSLPPSVEGVIELPDGTRSVQRGGTSHYRAAIPVPGRRASAGARTTRDLVDDPAAWADVTAAARRLRPEWSAADVAQAAWPYFNESPDCMAQMVGMSFRTPAEDCFAADLEKIMESPE